MVTPCTSKPHDLAAALHGLVQGGTPCLLDACAFLGVEEVVDLNPALAALRQIERKGEQVARQPRLVAASMQWPLVTRRIYIERADLVVSSLLHLAVGTPMAGARLNGLQGRWAHMILSGRAYLISDRWSRQQIRNARADLGWEPLWNVAITNAIILITSATVHQYCG